MLYETASKGLLMLDASIPTFRYFIYSLKDKHFRNLLMFRSSPYLQRGLKANVF